MQGFIKDHRKELGSDVWSMPPLYHRTWQWLKYNVNHEDATIPMRDGSHLTIKRGQRLTSIRDIAKSIGWYEGTKWKEPNPKTMSTILEWMVKTGMITIDRGQGNRQYTLITLVKYEEYQGKNDQGNSKVTAEKQCADINNNDKELKPSSRQSKTYAEDSVSYKMAKYLHDKIMEYAVEINVVHLVKDANLQKWADDCRKILELDKRDKAEVFKVIEFVRNDSFWRVNILSPDKLRKQYVQLALKMKSVVPLKPAQPIITESPLSEEDKAALELIKSVNGRTNAAHA